MTLSLTAPPWVVALIGFTVVLSGIAYFIWRARPRVPRIGPKGRTSTPPMTRR
jgi:hypothetical protein